jgi:hypothetical protein
MDFDFNVVIRSIQYNLEKKISFVHGRGSHHQPVGAGK